MDCQVGAWNALDFTLTASEWRETLTYLDCHFPLLEPRDHRMHSLPPATPRQTLLGQTPRRGAEHSENGSTVSRAALHERRKTTSHRCGEVGHMWGPAQGKSWPTPSPRDFGSNSAVSWVTHSLNPHWSLWVTQCRAPGLTGIETLRSSNYYLSF